jgi:TPP-dependent trihydroxycyclohexane-1,2-dione (THcHDO) dehydratase
LTDQLWLNLVWAKAREVLSAADNITFVGYSLPLTDIAASFLFTESVRPGTKINIVNFKTAKGAQSDLAASYLSVFPWLTAEMIDYRGALEWTREVTQSPSAQTN